MADIPKNSHRCPMTKNPITTDPALTKLLSEAKTLKTEEDFKGWKISFLDAYRSYLDPDGEQNASMSYARLISCMEQLAGTVVAVKDLVNNDKITAESQTVMGKRALTNMTDQMAKSEKEISRFMPATGADEDAMGYNKFELGAVMIEGQLMLFFVLSVHDCIVR
jgi:hypothetical protein